MFLSLLFSLPCKNNLEKTSSNFKLNETLVENYKIKEKTSAPITKPTGNKTSSKPNIIKEEIPDGYIEKLL